MTLDLTFLIYVPGPPLKFSLQKFFPQQLVLYTHQILCCAHEYMHDLGKKN